MTNEKTIFEKGNVIVSHLDNEKTIWTTEEIITRYNKYPNSYGNVVVIDKKWIPAEIHEKKVQELKEKIIKETIKCIFEDAQSRFEVLKNQNKTNKELAYAFKILSSFWENNYEHYINDILKEVFNEVKQ